MSSENNVILEHLIASGVAEARRGNIIVATELLKQISESQLHSESDYLRVGRLASMIGQHDYAIQLIQSATNLSPDLLDAWTELGNAYCNHGGMREAIDAYEKSLKINPDVILPGLAQAYDIVGNYDRADAELARIVKHRFKLVSTHEQDIKSPALLFALLPKSAGTSISRGVAQCVGYQHGNAVATTDHNFLPNARISPEAFTTAIRYPIRLHTHIRATDSNLEILNKSDVGKVVVHIRDPRQAVVSYYFHCRNGMGMVRNRYANPLFDNLDDMGKFSWFMGFYYPKFINWIAEWVRVENNISKYSFSIKTTTFEEMLRIGQVNLVRDICDFCDITIKTSIVEQKHRVRKGIADEWRSIIPERHHAALSEMIPTELKERFGWDS